MRRGSPQVAAEPGSAQTRQARLRRHGARWAVALPLLVTITALIPAARPAQGDESPTAPPPEARVRGARTTDPIARAAEAFARAEHLYVDPAAASALTADEVSHIADRLNRAATPIYIALFPKDILKKTDGNATLLAAEVHQAAGSPEGTVAVLAGGTFAAGSTILGVRARNIAAEVALRVTKPADRLMTFIDGIGLAATSPPAELAEQQGTSHRQSDQLSVGWLLPAAVLGAAGWLLYLRRRRRNREADGLRMVIRAVDEDLAAYGRELRALDSRLRVAAADAPTRSDYGRALEAYERAKQAASRTTHLDEVETVTAALEQGGHAVASARARMAGEPPPAHCPPCLFNPQHGPAARDIAWTPPGNDSRPIPCCVADARRLSKGEPPDVRMVRYGDGIRPYWDTGPAYASWAQGWYVAYGPRLLPMLLYGTALGDVWDDPTTPTAESPLDDLVGDPAERGPAVVRRHGRRSEASPGPRR